MTAARHGLRRLAGMIEFSLVAILFNMLVCADRAAAQIPCASIGPDFSNTQCGTGALGNNITGIDDSAFGAGALGNNTTGNNNTASGFDTLFNNTTGNSNTASGENALFSNTTGDNNTASGQGAL